MLSLTSTVEVFLFLVAIGVVVVPVFEVVPPVLLPPVVLVPPVVLPPLLVLPEVCAAISGNESTSNLSFSPAGLSKPI